MQNLIWYNTLVQPEFTPPAWVFPPVWTVLYLTMLISVILFVIKPAFDSIKSGYILFFSQLIVNLLWSPVFFYLKNPPGALFIILILDILVFLNILSFIKISKAAGLILLPYFVWIIFATYLNLGFVLLK